jgi:hypothetical protein
MEPDQSRPGGFFPDIARKGTGLIEGQGRFLREFPVRKLTDLFLNRFLSVRQFKIHRRRSLRNI